MVYTLAKWLAWFVPVALVAGIIGWLLRGAGRVKPEMTYTDSVAEHQGTAVSLVARPVAAGGDEPDVVTARAQLRLLERTLSERDALRQQLAECQAAHGDGDGSAPVGRALSDNATTGSGAPVRAIAASTEQLELIAQHHATISDFRARVWNHEATIADLREQLRRQFIATAPEPPDVEAAIVVLGHRVRLDDLTVIEGIGPRIAGLLQTHDIRTWWALANTESAAIDHLLNGAGPQFAMHDPTTWPRQARLLATGRWEEFKALTDALDRGRRS